MSKEANALKVGSFVIAGITVAVIAILVLGAGKLFSHRAPFMLYFADSVNGLTVGSQVKFKGVPVGTVSRIQVALREGVGTQYIPVLVEVDPDLILSAAGETVDIRNPKFVKTQIDKGLRASLELESFITGRLYVQFDFYPNAKPPVFVHKGAPPLEIPTISTGLSEFLKSLERLDLPGIAERVDQVLTNLQKLLEDAKLRDVSRQVVSTLEAFEKLVGGPEVKETLHAVAQASDEARDLMAGLRAEVKPVSGSLTNAADQAARTLAELQQTSEELRRLMGPDSQLLGEVQSALEEFSETARAIRLLAEYLNRNPRAVLTGRPTSETKP
jgi:paraquat-inducible protein B